MSSDTDPLLRYQSGRLFTVAALSTMHRLFMNGYSPVVAERWIDEDTLTMPGTPLGFHRPIRGGDIWTPRPGEEGKVSTIYLLRLEGSTAQPSYLIPRGQSQNPSIGIVPVKAPFLKRELSELVGTDREGGRLADNLRLDAFLENPHGTPAEVSRERQEAVLAYLDEYLRLQPA